jgi:hypothetical protein
LVTMSGPPKVSVPPGRAILSDNGDPALRLIRKMFVPLRTGELPKVSVPIAVSVPGASVATLLIVAIPEMVPVPPRMPALTVTAPPYPTR